MDADAEKVIGCSFEQHRVARDTELPQTPLSAPDVEGCAKQDTAVTGAERTFSR